MSNLRILIKQVSPGKSIFNDPNVKMTVDFTALSGPKLLSGVNNTNQELKKIRNNNAEGMIGL